MDEAPQRRVVLADSTPRFAATSPNDQYHARARQELAALEGARLRVAVLTTTIGETHRLILHRQGTSAAQAWLDAIGQTSIRIHPTDADFDAALQQVSRYSDQILTIYDALLFVVSERLSLPIWTYDFHFDVLGAQRWYGE